MKKLLFLLCFMGSLAGYLYAKDSFRPRTKKIIINTETDAKIFVDGKQISSTTTKIKVEPWATVNVRVEKVGYITEERNYINDGRHELPTTDYIKLEKDDAFESSMITDIANRDIDLKTYHTEDDSWKLIARIITNNFDVIQISDKTTGYMCTAWMVKNFKAATIRTRLIIKTVNTEPLQYKVKLISEIAPSGTSSSHDESFRAWDRLLRSFDNVIPELQSRLNK
ncbi:MAG: hypothetical protein KF825_13390 [Ferruginibacter sp.]|nr:hypothetical protein [Ferruginibacter sp.]